MTNPRRPVRISPRPKLIAAELCPQRDLHTEGPSGYVQWHDWAERMERTHYQCMCPGCGRYLIWDPRAVMQSADLLDGDPR
jgi:hypothetical protein